MNHSGIYFRIIIFITVLLWCTGFSLNVLTNGSNISTVLTPVLNLFYDNVCHQDENKLLSAGGFNFLVCARCSGIYFGALLASAFLLFHPINIKQQIFIGSCIILFADVVVNNFLLNNYNKISAMATGLLFGSLSLLIILNLLQEYLLYRKTFE